MPDYLPWLLFSYRGRLLLLLRPILLELLQSCGLSRW